MEPPVERYAIFITLTDFTIFNNPSLAVVRETCAMVTSCFPECCGTIILHKAPRVFQAAFAAAKSFIDPHTMSKIHFIVGDDRPGTANDAKLQVLLGSNWRQLTGVQDPKESPSSSRGYVHRECWRRVLLEERDWRRRTGNVGPGKHDLVEWPGGDPDVVPLDPCYIKLTDGNRPSISRASEPKLHQLDRRGITDMQQQERHKAGLSLSIGHAACMILVALLLLLRASGSEFWGLAA
eukprot:3693901-Amphidinium_carterae.1